ncbi:LptA/OstA family protein [Coraliomargarita parva]|uniref:LptA/OstA family protein n=1 Tax=Coraliomargarita parva TaxID=3014050 RepID=UPI0022B4E53D|nr:LptA/OstA family protein [Coraliomargarita parva]
MSFRRIFSLALSLCLAGGLVAQMTPNAPVKNFRVPRFAENGYTEWVLRGGQGIYDSAEQVRIEDMALRVYSGDERMVLEMTMDSPAATLRLQENRGFSEAPIEITGTNFKISGKGWDWDGTTKVIRIMDEAKVEFTQDLAGSLAQGARLAEGQKMTRIESKRLRLTTTDEAYRFEFFENVSVDSETMQMSCEKLLAVADAPEGRKVPESEASESKLDSLRSVHALEKVQIFQDDRQIYADEADFYPRTERAVLIGNARIEAPGTYLSGARMTSDHGKIEIAGDEAAGRSQMILSRSGGLGLTGEAQLSNETIILADTITMEPGEAENIFIFQQAVEVMSGALQVKADRMTIYSTQSPDSEPAEAEEMKVGAVREIVTEGSVRIEQSGQLALADKGVFYPAEERAVLSGSPRVTNGEAVLTGDKVELQPGSALVTGTEADPVVVTLPEMPDLGYDTSIPEDKETETTAVSGSVESKPTVVTSRQLRMIEEAEQTVFRFTDSVTVAATNLDASCQELDVISKKKAQTEATEPESSSSVEALSVERIIGTKDVVITQEGRVATADSVLILPNEGRLTLEGNAKVTDTRGIVSGHRLTLLQGQRRAIVEGGGPDGSRATITLPQMPGGKL